MEKAKLQLLELTNEKQLSSFSAEVRAKVQHHKFLIGKNGANIKKVGYIKICILKFEMCILKNLYLTCCCVIIAKRIHGRTNYISDGGRSR